MGKWVFVNGGEVGVDLLFISSGETSNDALLKAAKHLFYNDDFFMEHMSTRTVNMSFAEQFFFINKDEYDLFRESGEISIDQDEFIKRVRSYFGTNKSSADAFISFWFCEGSDEEVNLLFKEFVSLSVDILAKEWILFADLKAIPMNEVPEF